MSTWEIKHGDWIEVLKTLPDASVHCVVTSPPYFGLRDYGVPGQIGLEPTPAEFIGRLVEVFREVRRVLRSDGTCWLNMGDSYASSGVPGKQSATANLSRHGVSGHNPKMGDQVFGRAPTPPGGKPKDLLLIPERLAIALCDDGWYIRSRIIWAKPNPMPESVTDRPTKSHEHIWLMSKAPRYFYDADAIAEDALQPAGTAQFVAQHKQAGLGRSLSASTLGTNQGAATRNARDVWTIATAPFAEAHFATFPPELAERCIKAGCPKGGTVLDPFGGSGTTGLVADRLQRNAVLIELNPQYAAMAKRRLTNDAPLFAEVAL